MMPSGVEIYLALEPIDMRLSFDRLSGLAKERVVYEARSGALFVFFGRRRDALKVLFFDGSGMCRRGLRGLPPPPKLSSVALRDRACDPHRSRVTSTSCVTISGAAFFFLFFLFFFGAHARGQAGHEQERRRQEQRSARNDEADADHALA